jgi:ABC-2 type transport system ATP-binding protein
MADRIGVISKGELIVVEEKAALMRKLGKRQLILHLQSPIERVPPELSEYKLALSSEGADLVYTFDTRTDDTGIAGLMKRLNDLGIEFKDLETRQSSLEEIFIDLVRARP